MVVMVWKVIAGAIMLLVIMIKVAAAKRHS